MEYKILMGGDLHKRTKDISTIRGYCKAAEQVQLDIMQTIKDEGITHFISLGDWFDGGYGSDVAAALAHTDIDKNMSELLKGNFYGLIGNHIHIKTDSNPELFLIQPHPVYQARYGTVRDYQIIRTPDRLELNGVEILLKHWNHEAENAYSYKVNIDPQCKHHIGLFHTEYVIPGSALRGLNMSNEVDDNSIITNTLAGLDLAIVGHIHMKIGSVLINGSNGQQVNMIIPGSLTNTDAGTIHRHSSIQMPIITISEQGNIELSYHEQSMHLEMLQFLEKRLAAEDEEKLKSLRGNHKESLYKGCEASSFIGESDVVISLNKFLLVNDYTETDRELVRQVLHSPEDLDTLLGIYHRNIADLL